jgi:hypothetical protein
VQSTQPQELFAEKSLKNEPYAPRLEKGGERAMEGHTERIYDACLTHTLLPENMY